MNINTFRMYPIGEDKIYVIIKAPDNEDIMDKIPWVNSYNITSLNSSRKEFEKNFTISIKEVTKTVMILYDDFNYENCPLFPQDLRFKKLINKDI